MMDIAKQKNAHKPAGTSRYTTYSEIVSYLDAHWQPTGNKASFDRVKKLDRALQSPSQKVPTIIIAGTNGKSLAVDFTARLLHEEGLNVGTFTSPHLMVYNERFALNNTAIADKDFMRVARTVIDAAEKEKIGATTREILTVMALHYFALNNVDVAVLEATDAGAWDTTAICTPSIVGITRITPDNVSAIPINLEAVINEALGIVKPKSFVLSADQSKFNLQWMQEATEKAGGSWAMPIRKLAPLAYPFEQLHGRNAALAERIASLFINNSDTLPTTKHSMLAKKKGQRGRPTLEAKRQRELNPSRTIEQFWHATTSTLPGRFQLFESEKPTVLLDTAHNVDALENVLLGIRLINYRRPIKGLALIVGCTINQMENEPFLKALRYFFKKTSGHLILCPLTTATPWHNQQSWDVERVTNDMKSLKIKARSCKNFKEAFEWAKKSVDSRQGLVVVTGSESLVADYWHHQGLSTV